MALPTVAASFVASNACLNAFRSVKVTSSLSQAGTKYIGTHNGSFHCDEALAVSLLKLLPQFASHDILRTRDETKLQACESVVDVGGVYDASINRFDHHQKTFQGTFSNETKTRLSSAGLVYKHYGKEIIQVLSHPKQLDTKTLEILYKKTYKGFIEHIDGIDNGVEVAEGPMNYRITTTLSSRVSFLNPGWNEDQSEDKVNAQFQQAMYLTLTEFVDSVLSLINSWLPARTLVEKAITNRFETHVSGEIIYLQDYCPWKSHLYDIEKELQIEKQIKFVLYHDTTGQMVRVQAINVEDGGAFALRLGLLPAWRGLRDQTLSDIAQIEGCTFVHAAGFIGGNKTLEGAKQMAIQTLKQSSTLVN
jgi:uncharacterized UPF0160 family protein